MATAEGVGSVAAVSRRRHGLTQEVLDESLGTDGAGANRLVHWRAQTFDPEISEREISDYYQDARLSDCPRSSTRSLLSLAAAQGNTAAIRKLLSRGAVVDTPALCHAVWALNLVGVQELLRATAADRALLLAGCNDHQAFQCAIVVSPVLRLLRSHFEVASEVVADEARRLVPGHDFWFELTVEQREEAEAAAAPALSALQSTCVGIMEALVAAGFRVNVFRETCGVEADGIWRIHRVEGLQLEDLDLLDVGGHNRLVWSAYQPEPWSPQNHHGHAPAFKRAVKALLLTAHRRRPAPAPAQDEPRTRRQRAEMDAAGASCCQACLADLDSLLLLKIVGCAAHPLSAWLGG